jgi:hypothetical protein
MTTGCSVHVCGISQLQTLLQFSLFFSLPFFRTPVLSAISHFYFLLAVVPFDAFSCDKQFCISTHFISSSPSFPTLFISVLCSATIFVQYESVFRKERPFVQPAQGRQLHLCWVSTKSRSFFPVKNISRRYIIYRKRSEITRLSSGVPYCCLAENSIRKQSSFLVTYRHCATRSHLAVLVGISIANSTQKN